MSFGLEMKIYSKFTPEADCILFNGDCLDFLRQVPDESVQLVVTSPPYNIGKTYEERMELSEYVRQQAAVIEQCVGKLKSTGSICWQVGNYVHDGAIVPLDVILYGIFADLGLKMRNRIVWHYGHGLHATKRFSGRYEVVMWFTKGGDYTFNLDDVRVPQKYPQKRYFRGPKKGQLSGHPRGKNPADVWEIPNVKANHVEKTIHPCQFPVELVERLVLALTDKGDWVYDPFVGVGSTAVAALIHGRRVMGSEIVPEYIEIARRRLEDAEKGMLRIRPMERPVFDPRKSEFPAPPKAVKIGSEKGQSNLFSASEYQSVLQPLDEEPPTARLTP